VSQTTSQRKAQQEARSVLRWRRDQLIASGYDPRTAKILADRADVDLHFAVDLIGKGCPPAIAAKILL
jgi:hypothetical protein